MHDRGAPERARSEVRSMPEMLPFDEAAARVLDAWEEPLHDPHLPARPGPLLEGAGFQSYHAHCYSFGILAATQAFFAALRPGGRQEGVQ
jgi:hypothetical protein